MNRVDSSWSWFEALAFWCALSRTLPSKMAESKLHYSPKPREPKHGTRGNASEQLVCFASVLKAYIPYICICKYTHIYTHHNQSLYIYYFTWATSFRCWFVLCLFGHPSLMWFRLKGCATILALLVWNARRAAWVPFSDWFLHVTFFVFGNSFSPILKAT